MYTNKNFDFDKLKRKNFLNNEKYVEVSNDIKSNSPLQFLPCSFSEETFNKVEYGLSSYHLVLYGILKDGRRANVIIKEDPYFEVEIPDKIKGKIPVNVNEEIKHLLGGKGEVQYLTENEYISLIERILDSNITETDYNDDIIKIEITKKSVSKGKPFKLYTKELRNYYKFHFRKLGIRKAAIKLLSRTLHCRLISTDGFFRVLCRDNRISICSWCEISNYKKFNDIKKRLKGPSYIVDIKNYKNISDDNLTSDLLKEKSIIMSWDIETYSPTGELPTPDNDDHCICCIGLSFRFTYDDKPFKNIIICDNKANKDESFDTIVCKDEKNLLITFVNVINKIRPEFICGFNDGQYDWDWVIKRMDAYQLLGSVANKLTNCHPWFKMDNSKILNRYCTKEKIKLNADLSTYMYSLALPGYINIDTRVVFRQLYDKAEKSSLSYFLTLMQLDNKEDMAYTRMHNIYKSFRNNPDKNQLKELKEENRLVNKYCLVDAMRCHDLLLKKNVIMDRREISKLSYCSLHDAFYRANGLKVRNLTIAEGQKEYFKIKIQNNNNEEVSKEKFEGAYVFRPKRGLNISKYSIKERIKKAKLTKGTHYECLQEWHDVSENEIERYHNIVEKYGAFADDKKIKKIIDNEGDIDNKFIDFLKEKTKRPITGLDFSSLYPSLMMTYNFSPEKCIVSQKVARKLHEKTNNRLTKVKLNFSGKKVKGWFINHENEVEPYIIKDGKKVLNEKFNFGVYPYILRNLFNKRKEIKKKRKVYGDKIELFESKGDEYIQENITDYNELKFHYNYLDSKQAALKVFMNTFYGEAGNQTSPFFLIHVAGGITSYGRKNIVLAKDYVEKNGCKVHYGDTDSIYVSINDVHFSKYDTLYYSGKIEKLEYWTKLVEITIEEIKKINKGVNDMFFEDNNTRFLNMAYEEVLFPVIFTAKKKYFGIPHEQLINFFPQHLFVRGLDFIKRGVSGLLRDIFEKLARQMVDINNIYNPVELVKMKIDEIYKTDWPIEMFIMSKSYKPNKQNVTVQTFVKRMREERNIEIPEYDRFNCVIVKKYPNAYDYRGRKIQGGVKVGDKMELVDIVKKENLEIDLDHYFDKSIKNQFARVLTYHRDFHVEPKDNSKEAIKTAEEKIFKLAGKFISDYAKKYFKKYNNLGTLYKDVFKKSNAYFSNTININSQTFNILSGNYKIKNNKPHDIKSWIIDKIESEAKKKSKSFGKKLIESYPKDKDVIKQLNIFYSKDNVLEYKNIVDKQIEIDINLLHENIKQYNNSFNNVKNVHDEIIKYINSHEKIKKIKTENVTETENVKYNDIFDDDSFILKHTKIACEKIKNNKSLIKTSNDLSEIYTKLLAKFITKYNYDSILNEFKEIKNKDNRHVDRPTEQIQHDLDNINYSDLESINLQIC